MTLVLLSFLLLQLFQCSLRFLRGLSLVADPERKVLQSYGEFSYRANFLRLFFSLCRLSAIFLRFIPKNTSCFPISAPVLFSELSRLAAVALRRPFLKSECKGRHSPHSLQIFRKLFCTKTALMFVREIFKKLSRTRLQPMRVFTVFPNFFPSEIPTAQNPPERKPLSGFLQNQIPTPKITFSNQPTPPKKTLQKILVNHAQAHIYNKKYATPNKILTLKFRTRPKISYISNLIHNNTE